MSDIARNDERHRYELRVDGDLAGFAVFREEAGRIVFTHTVVLPAYEGRGLGSRLAKFVIEDALDKGLVIVPECPFIAAYLRRHPEYADSVVSVPAAD